MENIKHERSFAWYLLPLFFGLLGGIIAYFVVKEDNKRMANYCIAIGLVGTLAWFILFWYVGVTSLQREIASQSDLPESVTQDAGSTQSILSQKPEEVGSFSNTSCSRELGDIIEMRGKYTNGGKSYSFISLKLGIIDSKGDVVATGAGIISNIKPYETKIFDASGFYSDDFKSCTIQVDARLP